MTGRARLGVGLSAAAMIATAPAQARAFSEEAGATIAGQAVSTHHAHLTRALAACAGLPRSTAADPWSAPAEAERLALYDAASDVGKVGGVSACTAPTYALPSADDARAATGNARCTTGLPLAYPSPSPDPALASVLSGSVWEPAGGCFTARAGPYGALFHFPTDAELAALKVWATTPGASLSGGAGFAFGGRSTAVELYQSECYFERTEPIATGSIAAGSEGAFGLYLHALADAWSHHDCDANWGAKADPPWHTHTIADEPLGCSFLMHSWEYGCPVDEERRPFVRHTVDAAEAVYAALLGRAAAAGRAPAIAGLDAHHGWLRRQLERYAIELGAQDDPARRAAFTEALIGACEAAAGGDDARCLDDVPTPSGLVDAPCAALPLTAKCQGQGANEGGCVAAPTLVVAPSSPPIAATIAALFACAIVARRRR